MTNIVQEPEDYFFMYSFHDAHVHTLAPTVKPWSLPESWFHGLSYPRNIIVLFLNGQTLLITHTKHACDVAQDRTVTGYIHLALEVAISYSVIFLSGYLPDMNLQM